MRWYIVMPGGVGHRAFVLAETCDPDFEAALPGTIRLAAEGAFDDPRYGSAVKAWRAGDDREHAAWAAQGELETMRRDRMVAEIKHAEELGDAARAEELRAALAVGPMPDQGPRHPW